MEKNIIMLRTEAYICFTCRPEFWQLNLRGLQCLVFHPCNCTGCRGAALDGRHHEAKQNEILPCVETKISPQLAFLLTVLAWKMGFVFQEGTAGKNQGLARSLMQEEDHEAGVSDQQRSPNWWDCSFCSPACSSNASCFVSSRLGLPRIENFALISGKECTLVCFSSSGVRKVSGKGGVKEKSDHFGEKPGTSHPKVLASVQLQVGWHAHEVSL